MAANHFRSIFITRVGFEYSFAIQTRFQLSRPEADVHHNRAPRSDKSLPPAAAVIKAGDFGGRRPRVSALPAACEWGKLIRCTLLLARAPRVANGESAQ